MSVSLDLGGRILVGPTHCARGGAKTRDGRRAVRVQMAPPPDVHYNGLTEIPIVQGDNRAAVGRIGNASVSYERAALTAPVTKDSPVVAIDLPRDYPQSSLWTVADASDGRISIDKKDYTVMQKHVDFFDRNQDGVIYPGETYEGFRALGFSRPVSFLGSVLIHGSLSYRTYEGNIPDPTFPIYVKSIERSKHGSDTTVYTDQGDFVPARLEQLVSEFGVSQPGKMTYDELMNMVEAMRQKDDSFGPTVAKLEWGITHALAKDEQGYISKEAIAGVYDGTYFDYVQAQLRQGNDKVAARV